MPVSCHVKPCQGHSRWWNNQHTGWEWRWWTPGGNLMNHHWAAASSAAGAAASSSHFFLHPILPYGSGIPEKTETFTITSSISLHSHAPSVKIIHQSGHSLRPGAVSDGRGTLMPGQTNWTVQYSDMFIRGHYITNPNNTPLLGNPSNLPYIHLSALFDPPQMGSLMIPVCCQWHFVFNKLFSNHLNPRPKVVVAQGQIDEKSVYTNKRSGPMLRGVLCFLGWNSSEHSKVPFFCSLIPGLCNFLWFPVAMPCIIRSQHHLGAIGDGWMDGWMDGFDFHIL